MLPLVGCAVVDYDQGDVSNDDTQPVGNDGQKAGDQVQLVLLPVLLPVLLLVLLPALLLALVFSTWWFRSRQDGEELVGDPGRL